MMTMLLLNGTYGNYDFKGNFNNAEIFVNNDITKYLQVLGGVNFQQINMRDSTASKKDPSVTITSPYVSFFLHNFHGLSVEIGGRYNNHSKYGSNFTYSFNPSFLINSNNKI